MIFSEIVNEKKKKKRGKKLEGQKAGKVTTPLGGKAQGKAVFFYFFLRALYMGPRVGAYPSQRRPRRSEDGERVLYIFSPPKIIKIPPLHRLPMPYFSQGR
uniref:Uncharacterized protein n=1 Tax=Myoviridae sp. ctbWL16 TaxID=2826668 RepID=A0A8S5MS88_9CAUD|nr:MAG TPA: hypothetical protein [Myoviridae sp. ctbWL16]